MNVQELDADHFIAVVGLSGVFAGAGNIEQLWENLLSGHEALSGRHSPNIGATSATSTVQAVMEIQDVDLFDAEFFGYTQGQARRIDPQQRLLLETSWNALEHAGYNAQTYPGVIGLFSGCSKSTYAASDLETGRDLQAQIDNSQEFAPTRIAYKLDFRGPSVSIQTACSTSLVAVHVASQSLLNFDCDIALAGGVSIPLPQEGYSYQRGGIVSFDGHCRSFSADAAGTVPGRAAAVVALKRLADAVADRDQIYAVIRGTAINNDGHNKVGFTAPSLDGQVSVISSALETAGVGADTIGLIEGHGTATPLGDAIEIAALSDVFASAGATAKSCQIGSIKSNIGHASEAAGVCGLIKAVLCLDRKMLVPSVNSQPPNEAIADPTSPFFSSDRSSEWSERDYPRRAGVSSFGIGGTNAHAILEEAHIPRDAEAVQARLLPFSARTSVALSSMAGNLATHLAAKSPRLDDVAFTLQTGRGEFEYRDFVVSDSVQDAATSLRRLANGPATQPAAVVQRDVVIHCDGTSSADMAGLDSAALPLSEILQGLRQDLGEDVGGCMGDCRPSPRTVGELAAHNKAVFLREYCLGRLFQTAGVRVTAFQGRDVGELAAACLSGAVSIQDAYAALGAEPRVMDANVPLTTLLVGASPNTLRAHIRLGLRAAVFPHAKGAQILACPGLSDRLMALLRQAGMAAELVEVDRSTTKIDPEPDEAWPAPVGSAPSAAFISSQTGEAVPVGELLDGGYWRARFSLGAQPPDRRGPLQQRIYVHIGGRQGVAIGLQAANSPLEGERSDSGEGLNPRAFLEAVGSVWKRGGRVDWAVFNRAGSGRRVALPTYPFQRTRHWLDADDSRPALDTLREARAADALPIEREADADGVEFSVPVLRSLSPATLDVDREVQTGAWTIITQPGGCGALLAKTLEQKGAAVQLVGVGDPREDVRQDHPGALWIEPDRLDTFLQSQNGAVTSPRRVIVCPVADEDGCRLGNASSFLESVLQVIQGAAAGRDPCRVVVLLPKFSGRAERDDELADCHSICALALVTNQENPKLSVLAIEADGLVRASEQAQLNVQKRELHWLIADALAYDDGSFVAYQESRRWRQDFEKIPRRQFSSSASRLKKGAAYLVTGGLGHLGSKLAAHLSDNWGARIGVIARPTREISLARGGASAATGATAGPGRSRPEVHVEYADVSDPDQLRAAIAKLEDRIGRIQGVFHLAAELKHRSSNISTSEIDASDFEKQISPKAGGYEALRKAFADRRLDFGVVFSSSAAILGGRGRAAYAASNAYVDALLARDFEDNGLDGGLWRSINWDSWLDDAAIAEGLDQNIDLTNYGYDFTTAFAALETALGSELIGPQILVTKGNLQARLNTWTKKPAKLVESVSPDSQPSAVAETLTPTERELRIIWEDVLGMKPLEIDANFLALGGDSLSAVTVLDLVEGRFGVELPLGSLIQADASIRVIAREIDKCVADLSSN